METPWSTVGYLCYKRTYARDTGLGRTEEWSETIDRVLQAAQDIGVGFTQEENQRLQEYMLTLKGTVAGRFLWQMGTPTVDKLGLASLMNCAFVVVDSPIRPFTWTFDNLMLGSGVGYNIQRENVYKLPPVSEEFQEPGRQDNASADFIVPDTREGWVALLERTLEHAFGFRTGTFTYSTQLIRGKGAPIKGFGGTASGPEDLVRGITQISGVVSKRRGKQLRPIDCLDIMNIIGSVVVAGNVRRSAQIAIGDPDDLQFLKAKNWAEGVPNWRAMSNNSVVCNNIKELPEEFWKTYENGGEPYGLINLKLSQSCGRIGDTQYKDKLVRGFNPCLTYDMPLLTDKGYFPIGSLVGKKTNIWNGEQWSEVTPFSTGVNEIVRVSFTDGAVIDCTPSHKFLTVEGQYNGKLARTAAEDLKPGMKLQKWDMPVVPIQRLTRDIPMEAYSQGFYSGDGTSGYTHSYVYEPKYPCIPHLIGEVVSDANVGRMRWKHGDMQPKSFVPINKDRTYKLLWLAGLLDADGTVTRDANGNGMQLTSVDPKFLDDVRLLLTTLGCRPKVVPSRDAGMMELPDGKGGTAWYPCKDTKRLLIGNQDTFTLLYQGLSCHRLQLRPNAPQRDARQYVRVKSVEWLGVEEETFCVTEPMLNQMTVNGVVTGNCAEQPLANHEVCCLAEVFLPNVESKEELLDLCTLLYRVNKHALMLPCHNIETQDIVRRHMRMGIGVTGYLQCSEEQRSWLPEVYEQLRAFDVRYSAEHGMPVSIKLTTTKPSGTLSLLPGVTPGVHPGYAQYMIRRIRVASDSPMLDVCRNHGYPVEPQVHFDGTPDHSTYVVEFPFSYPQGTVLAKDLTAIQQLEWVERLQREWSDNAVSCTVYYKKEELPEIRAYLGKRYNKTFKSLSFLLHEDHGFAQAPFEEISAEEYALRMAECQVITSVDTASYESDDECSKGACPLR